MMIGTSSAALTASRAQSSVSVTKMSRVVPLRRGPEDDVAVRLTRGRDASM